MAPPSRALHTPRQPRQRAQQCYVDAGSGYVIRYALIRYGITLQECARARQLQQRAFYGATERERA